MELVIAPSILASDQGKFAAEGKAAEQAGADWLHIDVMDGSFVPPITFGAGVVKSLKSEVNIPLDVHLMINSPEKHIRAFAEAGASIITVHQETCPHLHRVLQEIKNLGVVAGVAINPSTPVSTLSGVMDLVDLILIMTVNPGWGGQKFIQSSVSKLQDASDLIAKSGRAIRLEVDGGVDAQTAPICRAAGVDTLVAGTYVFGSDNYSQSIASLRA